MIVFDNCDLDSACHSVFDAAWAYKGMVRFIKMHKFFLIIFFFFSYLGLYEIFLYKKMFLMDLLKN